MVVFVQDGNLLVREEAIGHGETIFDSGDVIDLTLSDDGQVVAFLLRSVVQITGHPSIDWIEQSALWAVDLTTWRVAADYGWFLTPLAGEQGALVAQDAEVCAEVLDLGDQIAVVHWIDGTRFLYVTREPYDLYFGKLNRTSIRLGQGAERFAAMAQTCRHLAGSAAGLPAIERDWQAKPAIMTGG